MATAGSDDTAEVMLPTPLVTSLCTAHKSSYAYQPVRPALSVMVEQSPARIQLSRLNTFKVADLVPSMAFTVQVLGSGLLRWAPVRISLQIPFAFQLQS